jgi:3-deoxy-manno-octulosonate cytidylyltransferase (CMP-KDO synthetase)
MTTVAIIPARMASTRFPGKPMKNINRIPMIGHVYYRTKLARNVDLTCVATCDREIYDYIHSIGGLAIMTSDTHERASDRTAEALLKLEEQQGEMFHYVAMIQGDEPCVHPDSIDKAIDVLINDSSLNIVNLMGIIESKDSFKDPNEVKVVTDLKNNALYFSREPIPSMWHGMSGLPMKKQTGLIFFRRDYLLQFNDMEQTPLEIIESVDMIRVLENGDRVRMIEMKEISVGVDNIHDFKVAEKLLKNDPLLQRYQNDGDNLL